ncbi:MAG TPA: hypothetical protein VD651_04175, partial [Nitrosarchaeum sp.]|nr:hypothetical protein [Nitrosarchaeum sp.]
MKLMTLSDDLVGLIGLLLPNQNLGKLIYYTQSNPLNQPNFNTMDLAPFGKIERYIPQPFDVDFTGDVRNQLHVYFQRLEFKNNSIVEDVDVFFDIITHKSIWTMRDSANKKKIRPYEIAKEIIFQLKDVCEFTDLFHIAVND